GCDDADDGKVARKGDGAQAGRGRGGRRCRLQVGATCAADRFEAGGDVDARVVLLGFEQTLVRGVEIFACDVELHEREALARGLFGLTRRRGDLAYLLTQTDRV